MGTSTATTVAKYLSSLPAERRAVVSAVRDVVNANLPEGYEETMQYGMISWIVPLATKPDTYNKQPLVIAALAAQKSFYALYLMGLYIDAGVETWFRGAFATAGKKLDMGKSCVRFTRLDALPLDVVGEAVTKVSPGALIAHHDATHGTKVSATRAKVSTKTKPAPKAKPAKKSSAAKKR